jgi:hypothetical protein
MWIFVFYIIEGNASIQRGIIQKIEQNSKSSNECNWKYDNTASIWKMRFLGHLKFTRVFNKFDIHLKNFCTPVQ